MTVPCRLLPFQVAEGPANMARDEALLHSAVERRVASLRLYGWAVPTLSLGYFQSAAPARAFPGLGVLPWLRRPSGGSALVHHHELTYALALPAGPEWQGGSPWLVRFHQIIVAVLADLGVGARRCEPGEAGKLGEVLCFLHHTPGDVLIGPAKVVGSAQRKVHGALLQHGSILLAQSPHTPLLPGIAELTGRTLAVDEIASALVDQFGQATGWTLAADVWTAQESRLVEEIMAERYTSPRWNDRR
jgi:lipoate-protein ligase A